MQQLDLASAKDKILADTRRYLSQVQAIVQSPAQTLESGIRALVALRRTSYEDLNQIQHEYAAFCAVEWLVAQRHAPQEARWYWNPRQTGDSAEPDIRATVGGVTIISGEVTTSPQPKGLLDTRMASTLRKLSVMEGRQFYFVLTTAMANRARTKAAKAGYSLEIVRLQSAVVAVDEPK